MGDWDTIRDAIASKLSASTGCATAGLRGADTATDDPEPGPWIRVLQVSAFEITGRPNAWQEQYRLTIPAELLVPQPSGRKRSEPKAIDIARAAQVEFRTGIKLGLSSYVDECVLAGWSDGLVEYGFTGQDGGRFTFLVDVTEILSSPRTA